MKVYKLVPGRPGYVKEIDNTLESLQNEVGGYIEICRLDNNGLVAIVDEEGVIKELPANAYIPNYGVIRGNIVIAKDDGEDFTSLNDDDIDKIKEMFDDYEE